MRKVRKRPLALPPGPLKGPAAWRGEQLACTQEWQYHLSAEDLEEIESVLAAVERSNMPLIGLRPEHFRLPRLAAILNELRHDVLRGRGFVLLRGLPVERWSREQAAICYWGLGLHFGHPVSQNAMGHLLGHVIDIGRDDDDPTARTYQTNVRQFYHSDSCDIVGLLCLCTAKHGGESTIVSSVTLFNEMQERSPELAEELFRPVHFDRRGEVPPGAPPWYEMPIFNWYRGELSTHYVRRYIVSVRRFREIPELTERQIAAFDLLDEIADNPAIHLAMALAPGDVQFLHNPQILHDRRAFEDWPEPDRRRHLLRLWLCAPDGRPLPPAYAGRWGSNEIGNRGGILVEGAELAAPLAP